MIRAIRWLALGLVLSGPMTGSVGAQRPSIYFTHLTLEDGLSQSIVNTTFQDRQGFLWFGTGAGLNRFDGADIRVYRRIPGDERSLPDNQIWSLSENAAGQLIVGTSGGLARFDPATEQFDRLDLSRAGSSEQPRVRAVLHETDGGMWIGTDGQGVLRVEPLPNDSLRPADSVPGAATGALLSQFDNSQVRALVRARDGSVWVGTYGDGLFEIDESTGTVGHWVHDPGDVTSLGSDQIRTLVQDRAGRLWIGTYEHGLNRLDEGSATFVRYRHDPTDPRSLSSDRTTAIMEDVEETLWIGTEDGLNEWVPDTVDFHRHLHRPSDPNSLAAEYVFSLFQDRGNVIWVGTLGVGLSHWNPTTVSFRHFRHDSERDSTLSHDSIQAIEEGSSGELWIGTHGGGLNRMDSRTGRVDHFRHDPATPWSLSDDRIGSLVLGPDGDLWVGTYRSGLDRLESATARFDHFRHDASDGATLASDQVISLEADEGRRSLWVGLFGAGFDRLDLDTLSFEHHRHDDEEPRSLSSDRVTVLHLDRQGQLVIGTYDGGLSLFDPESNTFEVLRSDPERADSLSGDRIWSVLETEDGDLWIGTADAGLNRWAWEDRRAGRPAFERFGQPEGLHSESVYGILADDEGRLWLSTDNGVFRFDRRELTFRGFSKQHGLQSAEFNFGAHLRASDGVMYFGGVNGLNSFRPEEIGGNRNAPPVALTSVSINGEVLWDGASAQQLSSLSLGHRDSLVSFDFVALDFTDPAKNRYAYRLDPFDDDWIELDRLRRATFTNLSPGRYTLRVKAANNDGVWNDDGLSIPLDVAPPPWRSAWAYSLYVLAALGALLGALGIQRGRERRAEANRILLEQQVEQRTRELADRNLELREANERLEQASVTDALTGLRNRHYLLTYLKDEVAGSVDRFTTAEEVAETTENGSTAPLAPVNYLLLMIDLDGFKPLNDAYGHAAGDEALVEVGQLLRKACRKTDTIIRWGGDEFMVVARYKDASEVDVLGERILRAIRGNVFDGGEDDVIAVGCSIGMVSYPFFPEDHTLLGFEDTLKLADLALYAAKRRGRGLWLRLESTDSTPRLRVIDLVSDRLEEAIESGQITIHTSRPTSAKAE